MYNIVLKTPTSLLLGSKEIPQNIILYIVPLLLFSIRVVYAWCRALPKVEMPWAYLPLCSWPRGISPTPACCLLGPTTTGAELPLPKIHHSAFPFPTTKPPTHTAQGYQEHHQCIQLMQPTSLSQKQGKVHMSAQLQPGRQSIEGGGANPMLATKPANLT